MFGPLRVDDRLGGVVVGDRRVVLARERQLDHGEIVDAAAELAELLLGVAPDGVVDVTVPGLDLDSHRLPFPSGHGPISTLANRPREANHIDPRRTRPAQRASAQALTVDPVV